MIRFNTDRAHPVVLDFLAAKLANVELCLGDGFMQIASAERSDEEGVIFPLAWEPRESVLQLDRVESGRGISTMLKHDGLWRACVFDVNDEQQHFCVEHSRAAAVVKCAVKQQFGEEVALTQAEWDVVAPALAWADFLKNRAMKTVEGSLTADMLPGVVFPMPAWEIVECHSIGQVTRQVRALTIHSMGRSGTGTAAFAVATDATGQDIRLPLHDVFLTEKLAAAHIQQMGECEGASSQVAPSRAPAESSDTDAGPMVHLRFHPQAWQNDYAIPADASGPVECWVPRSAIEGPLPEDRTYDSDELREVAGTPGWWREWTGPFEVTIANRDELEEALDDDTIEAERPRG